MFSAHCSSHLYPTRDVLVQTLARQRTFQSPVVLESHSSESAVRSLVAVVVQLQCPIPFPVQIVSATQVPLCTDAAVQVVAVVAAAAVAAVAEMIAD